MLDLAPMQLLLVAVIAVLLFGAKRLPGVARGIGSGAREFQRGLRGEDT